MGIEHLLNIGEDDEQPIQEVEEQTGEIGEASDEGSGEGSEERVEGEESIEREILGEEGSQEEESGEVEVSPGGETYKVKVHGQELELTLDELKSGYATNASSTERYQQAAKRESEAKALVNGLKEDPIHILSQLGVDVKKLANDQVAKQVEYELMDEAEKRAHDYKLELDRLNRENEERSAFEERQKREAELQQAKQSALTAIEEAIDANPQLPKNNFTISKMASYMAQFKEAGREPPMDRVAAKVKADYEEQNRLFIENMSPEDMAKYLGESNVRKLAKHQGQKANTNKYQMSTARGISETPTKDPKKGVSRADWRKYLANIQ